MSSDIEDIEALFRDIYESKSEEELIQEEADILQANYLSEIERLSIENGFNRKELAQKIKTSPSYLTQVFRGDKPLNFLTIAKIKMALNLEFEVRGYLQSERKTFVEFNIQSQHSNSHQLEGKNFMKVIYGDVSENNNGFPNNLITSIA